MLDRWRRCGRFGSVVWIALAAIVPGGLCAGVATAAPADSLVGFEQAPERPGSSVSLGEGIARFYAPGVDPASLPPSLAMADPKVNRGVGPVPAGFADAPGFWRDDEGRYNTVIPIAQGTSLYGTGMVAGSLLRNGRKIVCWNTDAYGYTESNPSLYQSHPWVLAVRADGTAFGVLADTIWRTEIDLTGEFRGGATDAAGSIVFRGEGGPYGVVVIQGDSPQQVLTRLSGLIGTMPMPPMWAIGYHQCRYSYHPESRVREIAHEFRSRNIPCDVIWFDIDYMDGFRVFTFDSAQFPDPKGLNRELNEDGFSCIWMIDPGIKAEDGYFVYDQGTAANAWVRNAAGEVYKGEVWPGWCVFPDYTRPDVRKWWESLYKDFMAQGINGVWNDMNEPAVFNVASKTMPEDNVHEGGAWDYGGTLPRGPHLQYHNVYGLLMAKGTYDGIRKTNPTLRPFVLTRAGYIGSHRYAATWTGDNSAEWDDLEHSVSMALNLGLSGQPFSGPDIGGFNGNGDAALFSRWMGVGALLPFSRGHTGKGNIDKEPWAFGPEVEATSRKALERRYRLMPYLYTVFREASRTGLPVARPVFFADPKDPALRAEDDAFLLGADLLVVPRLTPLGDRVPSLPRGDWARIRLVDGDAHPDLPDLLVRPGAIVPLGPVVQHTKELPKGPLVLVINLDEQDQAMGVLYEDDGDGFAFTQGRFLETTYRARVTGERVEIEPAVKSGDLPRRARPMIAVVHRGGKWFKAEGIDGMKVSFEMNERNRFDSKTTIPGAIPR
ncbi:MAG: DUF5110 domain-containing protein [Phycisphaeraceae bacterium]|nr:DUF5110 domain-containing protein [Phycisphaeraceae bacterium]